MRPNTYSMKMLELRCSHDACANAAVMNCHLRASHFSTSHRTHACQTDIVRAQRARDVVAPHSPVRRLVVQVQQRHERQVQQVVRHKGRQVQHQQQEHAEGRRRRERFRRACALNRSMVCNCRGLSTEARRQVRQLAASKPML